MLEITVKKGGIEIEGWMADDVKEFVGETGVVSFDWDEVRSLWQRLTKELRGNWTEAVTVDLEPLTVEAMEATWVKKDKDGFVDREIVFNVTPEVFRIIWSALPCTERFTWPDTDSNEKRIGELVMRRPVVFRKVPT